MDYKKGNHCNNKCRHFFTDSVTIYNRNHGGNPGSSDYDVTKMFCTANSEEGIELLQVVYNCPIYQAAERLTKVIEA